MNTDKIAIIGAGKTGRGFIARLLKENDHNVMILFVDKNTELVHKLNSRKSYKVSFFGQEREPVMIDHYRAATWEDADFDEISLFFISVGETNLQDAGKSLSLKLSNKKYSIIACENSMCPAKTLAEALGGRDDDISEAAVFCTTVEDGRDKEETDILSENYPFLQYDREKLRELPAIRTLKPVSDFPALIKRKLYTYNSASCVIAYTGALLGYSAYADAANDPVILDMLAKHYGEINRALCKQYGCAPEDQKMFSDLSLKKFTDRTIRDSIARNAREPHRKLTADERIIGTAKCVWENGGNPDMMCFTAAAAILYSGDKDFEQIKEKKSYTQILTDICGLRADDEMAVKILKYIDKINAAGDCGKDLTWAF